MGAMDDLLAEYEGTDSTAPAKTEKVAKYPSVEELFGGPKQQAKPETKKAETTVNAQAPAQMPPTARPGDSGLLPVPEPVSFGGAMRAIGDQFVKEGKAIPAAFNDAFSMGAIPAIQEAKGGSLPPGSYQQAMEAGPVGTVIGQTGGILASGGAGLAKPLAEGGQMLASGLRRLGAFVSPTVEKAVASGVASGAYAAADAAIRGGTPEQVLDAGMSAGTLGAGVPLVVGGMSKAKDAVANKLFSHQAEPLVPPPVEVTPENIGISSQPPKLGAEPPPVVEEVKPPPEPKPYSVADRVQKKGMLDKAQELLNASVRRNAIKGTNKIAIGAAMSEADAAKAADAANMQRLGVPIEVQAEGEGSVSGGAKAVASSAERLGLEKELLGSVPEFTRKVLIKRNQIGQQIGQYTGSVIDEAGNRIDVLPTPGVRMDALLKSFESEMKKTAPGTARHDALLAEIEKIRGLFRESNVVKNMPHVPIWQVSDLAQDAAMKGYGVTPISTTDLRESQKIARIINQCYRRPMYDEVNRVLVRNPSLGSPEKFAKLRAQYTEASGLADIAMSARPQAYLGRPGLIESVKELGEKLKEHKAEAAISAPAALGAYLAGGKAGKVVAGMMAAAPLVKPVLNEANAKLAKLVVAARNGASAESYSILRDSLGVDPAIASTIWQRYGAPAVGFTSARAVEPLSSPELPQ